MVSTPSAPLPQQIRQTSTAEPPGYVRPLIDEYMTRGEDLSNLPFAPLPTAAERLQGVDPNEALGYGNILTQAQGPQPGIAAANAAMLNPASSGRDRRSIQHPGRSSDCRPLKGLGGLREHRGPGG